MTASAGTHADDSDGASAQTISAAMRRAILTSRERCVPRVPHLRRFRLTPSAASSSRCSSSVCCSTAVGCLPQAVTDSIEGIIVGYFLWSLTVGAYQSISNDIGSEAQWGTLERHVITPLGFEPVAFSRASRKSYGRSLPRPW